MTAGLQLGNNTLGCRHKPFPALLLLFALAERNWLPNEIQQRINHKSVGHDVKVNVAFSRFQCVFLPVYKRLSIFPMLS